jgi:AraC-like DNA-binding protein
MLSALLDHGLDIRRLTPAEGASPLACQLDAAGFEQRRNEVYSWDGMKRGTTPFLVIQHTILGEGRLDYAGTRHRLVPGQTMLVTMPHAHRYWLERGGAWEYFWLLLSGREALRLAREVLAVAGPVLSPGPGALDRLAEACLKALTRRPTPGEASTLAYQAMAALVDTAFAAAAPAPALPPALARVAAFVEAHLAEPLPVDRLAGVAGMSRAHFVRQFTAHLGLPPSDHVAARRLERVERLLLATEMRVGEIAAATGFADGNYLAKVFRRHRGMTPLDFRATRAEAL